MNDKHESFNDETCEVCDKERVGREREGEREEGGERKIKERKR